MDSQRIYQLSSIARPLDHSFATNRAVARLAPIAGVTLAIGTLIQGGDLLQALSALMIGTAVAFGSWALGRELDPDHNATAFICMALAYGTTWLRPSPSLVLLFFTLFVVRMINRTVGKPARITDSIAVLLLLAWAIFETEAPAIGLVAALGFGLDAILKPALRHQWFFAAAAGAVALGLSRALGVALLPSFAEATAGSQYLIVAIAIGFALTTSGRKPVMCKCDTSDEVVSTPRVRAAMAVALLVAAQVSAIGAPGTDLASPIWATLGGVFLALPLTLVKLPPR